MKTLKYESFLPTLQPLKDEHDESAWEIKFVSYRKEISFIDRTLGGLECITTAYLYSPGMYLAEYFYMVCQIDRYEFIVYSIYDDNEPAHISIIRLCSKGNIDTLFYSRVKECGWILHRRLLYINDGSKEWYYLVGLHSEIGHFLFEEIGHTIKFDIVSYGKYNLEMPGVCNPRYRGESYFVHTREGVIADFCISNMDLASMSVYSVLREKRIEASSFQDFVSILKEDESDAKKAEEINSYNKFYDFKSGVTWRECAAQIATALIPEILKRDTTDISPALGLAEPTYKGSVEAEYRFKPWPIAKGTFDYDKEKYSINRAKDALIIEDKTTGAAVAVEGGLCVGLYQLPDEKQDTFLAVFEKDQCRKEGLWLHRFRLYYDTKKIELCYEYSFAGESRIYRLKNADCQYTEDLVCLASGVYSISKNCFLEKMKRFDAVKFIAVQPFSGAFLSSSRFPAAVVSFGYWENSVFAIIGPEGEVIGGVTYNQLSQSFMKANIAEDCEHIADENPRLQEWVKAALSAIEP